MENEQAKAETGFGMDFGEIMAELYWLEATGRNKLCVCVL